VGAPNRRARGCADFAQNRPVLSRRLEASATTYKLRRAPNAGLLRGFNRRLEMNKKEAAAALGISLRLVEKYAGEGRLGDVRYVRGKTGKQADYDSEAVERLRAELESVDRPADPPHAGGSALVAPAQAAAFRQLAALLQSARPVDPRPVLLTREQAVEATGLPPTWLRLAVKARAVEQIGRGRAARLRRDEVLALAAREDLAQLVESWHELSPEQTRDGAVRGKSQGVKAGK
jgi:hypothetical protein